MLELYNAYALLRKLRSGRVLSPPPIVDCLVIQFLNNNHSDFTFWRTDNSPRDAAVR